MFFYKVIRYQSSDTVSVPVIFVVLVAEHIRGDPRIALLVMYSAAVYPGMGLQRGKGQADCSASTANGPLTVCLHKKQEPILAPERSS